MKLFRVAVALAATAFALAPQVASALGPGATASLGSTAAVDGTQLTISGTGFSPSVVLTVRMGADVVGGGKGGECTNYPADYCRWPVSTDDAGAFSATLTVPLGMKGPVNVDVQDHVAHETTSAGQFTATQVPIRVHLSNTRPRPGSTITITAGGLHPGGQVRLYVNSRLLTSTLRASHTGRFSYEYKVSTWARGSNSIRVQDTFIHQFAGRQFIVP